MKAPLRLITFLTLLLSLSFSNAVCAGPAKLGEEFERKKQEAYAVAQTDNREEAKKLLAALLKRAPDDGGILFRYGYLIYLDAAAQKDVKKANRLRKEARSFLARAQESGLVQPLLTSLLNEIGSDGSVAAKKYSKNPEANAAVQQGEFAFQKRDYETALSNYSRALTLDPNCYVAALYIGDTYFTQGKFATAIEWFAKAVAIDGTQEQAHRYWGDSLDRLGNQDAAGEKYVDAVIAEPFSQYTWRMLDEWASKAGLDPHHPAANIPRAGIAIKNGKIELSVDQNAGTLGVAYGVVLAAAATKAVNEKQTYQHALATEVRALQALLEIGEIALTDPKIAKEHEIHEPLLQQVKQLRELVASGNLEPYIFFVRADADLAREYAAYRNSNRDKLVAYLRSIYLGTKR